MAHRLLLRAPYRARAEERRGPGRSPRPPPASAGRAFHSTEGLSPASGPNAYTSKSLGTATPSQHSTAGIGLSGVFPEPVCMDAAMGCAPLGCIPLCPSCRGGEERADRTGKGGRRKHGGCW